MFKDDTGELNSQEWAATKTGCDSVCGTKISPATLRNYRFWCQVNMLIGKVMWDKIRNRID